MEEKINATKKLLNRAVDLVDSLVLAAIALGTLILAIQMVAVLVLEFVSREPHSLPNMVSELMFVLIVMELFRQIVRQIRKEPFSLKPFLAIGIIASVRGLLVVQMKIGIGDLDWKTGSLTIVAFSLVILLLIAAYYLCYKSEAAHS
ncbi:phosphate-starvation-inducible PsiE family protein [Rhodoferax sp.]|uniref:phosphate-starvation-inducible PsiE family protein n=1 Tax=Rhodoferax sp. TaxID=50421 RepID=UPI00271B4F02|nr:phosphate-starvation-inducible PsiE family protein [Rhodoferax sp.]MDO9196942.1 phosphate-starvation-inducible PsiE family protein [Rhodoferax sp.]